VVSAEQQIQSEWGRKLRAFYHHPYALWSTMALSIICLLSCFSEVVSNSRPLVIQYKDQWYFPIFKTYSDQTFGGMFETEADYKDPDTIKEISSGKHLIIWPLNRWDYKAINQTSGLTHPSPPSKDNWLGTDDRGRDVFARLLYGVRVSIGFGVIAVILFTVFGIIIGAIQGFFGGWIDLVLQRMIEVWDSLPYLYVLIILASIIEPGLSVLIILLAVFNWTRVQEYVRIDFLRSRELDYVRAAKALGVSDFRIMWRHILPNTMTNIVIRLPFAVIGTIDALVSLDFLGFGVQSPTPSLGDLFKQAQSNLQSWWLLVYSGGTLLVLTLLVTMIGFAALDIIDPKRNHGG
jgi:microcin C transport system permease protein